MWTAAATRVLLVSALRVVSDDFSIVFLQHVGYYIRLEIIHLYIYIYTMISRKRFTRFASRWTGNPFTHLVFNRTLLRRWRWSRAATVPFSSRKLSCLEGKKISRPPHRYTRARPLIFFPSFIFSSHIIHHKTRPSFINAFRVCAGEEKTSWQKQIVD